MSQFEFDDMDDLNEEYYFDTIEEFQSCLLYTSDAADD